MDAFISHSSSDRALAERLATDLTKRGFSVWLDLGKLSHGESFQTAISRALTDSRAIILLIGSEGRSSDWQRFEWRKAVESTWSDPDKKLLGVLIGTNEIPPFLAQWKVLKVDPEGSAWDRVVDELALALREAKTKRHHWPTWRAFTRRKADELQAWTEMWSPSPEYLRKQKEELQRSIDQAAPDDALCDRLFELAVVERDLGELQEAREVLLRALQISMRLGDAKRKGLLLVSIAAVEQRLGNFDHAIGRLHEALDLYRSIDRPNKVLSTLSLLASFCREGGHPEIGKKYLEEAIALSRVIGEMAYPSIATLEHQLREYDRTEAGGSR
jgi:tetratricopeptide (TPR) repeat protein